MNSAIITSWLLTYLVHSTILLSAVWLVSRALADRRLALQEILLRTALVGGLITATVQVGFGVEPIGGSLALDGLSATEATVLTDSIAADTTIKHGATLNGADVGFQVASIWPVALLLAWVVGSLLALFVLGRSILDLRRLLKTRRFRPTGRLLDRLTAAMGLRRPVRLSTSAAIAVPFATGISRPEICCPERVDELASEHQNSLFAHELAHLARRDPAWQLIYRFGEALLFLQPLNRFARRRLEEIAEHLTDEKAVACTGDRLGLARSLVVVAHWGFSNSPGLPATGFAAGPRLDRRVRHLLSGTFEQHRLSGWTAPLLIAVLAMAVLLLPAIGPRVVHADVTAPSSDAASIHPWSPAESATTDSPSPTPQPVEPPLPDRAVPEAEPAVGVAPRAPVEPQPVSAPAPPVKPAAPVESAPPAAPVTDMNPVPAPAPAALAPPSETVEPTPVKPVRIPEERSREEARERQRADHEERERSEARARQRAREVKAKARELEREAAERSRLAEVELNKLRNEARERARQSEIEARELAERARERSRITDTEREESRRRAEALRAAAREQAREASNEAREQARALAERARRLAEESEAERRAEEKRQQ